MSSKKENVEYLRKMIRKLKKQGKTYQELGAMAGVASTTINRIEKGETQPRVKTIKKILRAFEGSTPPRNKGVLKGFTSKFGKQHEGKLRDELQYSLKELKNVISDDSLPYAYKKSLARIILSAISSIRELREEI